MFVFDVINNCRLANEFFRRFFYQCLCWFYCLIKFLIKTANRFIFSLEHKKPFWQIIINKKNYSCFEKILCKTLNDKKLQVGFEPIFYEKSFDANKVANIWKSSYNFVSPFAKNKLIFVRSIKSVKLQPPTRHHLPRHLIQHAFTFISTLRRLRQVIIEYS